jgi:UDP-3-O-[3-hydroxymyristoyl] N-acetylglucosamine deacetylase
VIQQHTIKHVVSCFGIGIHSGRPTSISLYPAAPNTGITFIRTDIKDLENKIHANYSAVSKTNCGTTIKNTEGLEVATVEHLMAAFWGCKIDNVIVEVDGPEIPSMDGSAEPFVFMIECAGVQAQEEHRKYLEVLKEISVEDGETKITISPNEYFHVDMQIKYNSDLINIQKYSFSERKKSFKHEVARARTFGFKQEEEALRNAGLAKGASLDNVIVINDEKILNSDGLRYKDEFVRHKLLDLIGDFYLTGASIKGAVTAFKPGHKINNKAICTLLADKSAYRFVENKY